MVINLHRLKTRNIGDLLCAPSLYFPLGDHYDILGWKSDENPEFEDRKKWKEDFSSADMIIIGGGGLLSCDFFDRSLDYVAENKKIDAKVVIWGAGHNEWKLTEWRGLKQPLQLDDRYDLIGVRDYGHKYDWVPCASCMHPAFDTESSPTHEVVLYAHAGALSNPRLASSLPTHLPTLSNSADFESVIKFLSSGDLILTDSYHGLYWATLLGKRVVAFPASSKFYDVKHAAPLCDPTDWQRFAGLAISYPDALQECREANLRFHEKVMNL